MGTNAFIGLCVLSHDVNQLNHSVFDNVQINGVLAKPTLAGALLPEEYSISQNHPNPFNPETTIAYALPEDADVSLIVYNVLGQPIRTLVSHRKAAGQYRAVWDSWDDFGRQVASGIYLYRILAGEFIETRKMLILK